MKHRVNWLIIPAVALGLGACNKKQEAKAPEAPAAVATTPTKETPAAEVVPVPKVLTVTPEERAAKLGFVKHLPQDTEVVLSFYNGTKTAGKVKASKLWKLVEKQMGGGMGAFDEAPEPGVDGAEDPEVEAEVPQPLPEPEVAGNSPMGPAMLFGKEFTIAMGKATGEQSANLLTLSKRINYFQMRGLAKAFVASAKKGDASSFEKSIADSYTSELLTNILKDPESGIGLLDKAKMPPLYVAFRVDEAQRPAAAQQLAAMLDNASLLGEMVETVEAEKAGQKFEGFKISGAKISATMAADRAEMDAVLEPATVDQLLAVVAKKDIVVASGTVGDYVVLFVGSSMDDLKLADAVGQSLAGSNALEFSDAYVSKDLAALVYGQDAALDKIYASVGGLAEMANGIRDGLAGSDGLGDTRDLEAMFQIVAEREAALRKLTSCDALGSVVFFEDGLKIESYGGPDSGAIAWQAPNKLSHLGDSADVVLFADVTVDANYDEKAHAYFESLLETAYAVAMKVSDVPIENEEVTKYKEMAKMFDTKFRPDMVALWDAFSEDFDNSRGNERAMVIDLKGAAPAIPGIPQAVVDKAKVPRISLLSPVTDRAKLSASWDKMNSTTTGILAKVSEMVGQDIPMQKPLSSERNGLVTWFFPMPFFNDDFLPSVTVGDQWFAASTSKNQALDLIAQASAATETRTGLFFSLNFRALENYATETSKVVDQNAEAMMGAPLTPQTKKMIKDSIAVLSDLDKLTVHSRREGAVQRSSIHFKTR